MHAEPAQFDIKPLLRPNQVEIAKGEIASLKERLVNPHIEDKGEVAKQLRRVTKSFEEQVPRPPVDGEEEGRMVSRSRDLLNDILLGMPSQEEMRKCPPGAVDKHRAWQKANKFKIAEWKNIRLRLTRGEEADAANLERHRPVGNSLLMDNAYIPGKMFFMPPAGAGLPASFSAEQLAFLRSMSPELADTIGLMNNEQRREVKKVLDGGIGLDVAPEPEAPAERSAASIAGSKGVAIREAKRKKKRTMSPEHKVKLLAAAAAARLRRAQGE